MSGGGLLIKEEGVGINCSEPRKAGQGSWFRRLQGPTGAGGQDTLAEQLPADSALPTLNSSFWFLWLPGEWRLEGGSAGQLDEGRQGGRRKVRLYPTIPFPHPIPHFSHQGP